jgi:hypothetical protein
MQNAKGYQRQSLFWTTGAAVLLAIWLAAVIRHPIRLEDRIRSPGFGWSWDFNYERAMQEPRLNLDSLINRIPPTDPDQFVLTIGDAVSIEGLQITYRGMSASGRLRLDVVVPDLDPVYSYPYELSVSEARVGFVIFNQRFILDAMGRAFMRVRHIDRNNQ